MPSQKIIESWASHITNSTIKQKNNAFNKDWSSLDCNIILEFLNNIAISKKIDGYPSKTIRDIGNECGSDPFNPLISSGYDR